jgi:hypothetical protein
MDEGGYHGVHFGGGNFVPGAANLINGINDQGVVAGSLIIGGQLNAGGGIPVDPHVLGPCGGPPRYRYRLERCCGVDAHGRLRLEPRTDDLLSQSVAEERNPSFVVCL